MLNDAGFTEYGFMADIKQFYKHFSDNIGSSVAYHCIASQVWTAFEKMLYGNGKQVRFKKNNDVEWTEWVFENNTSSEITLNKGEKLYVMSDSYNSCAVYDKSSSEYKYYYFTISVVILVT